MNSCKHRLLSSLSAISNKKPIFWIIVLLLTISTLLLPTFKANASQEKPSFDCKEASTPVEKTICSNSEIALLDRVLDYVYKVLHAERGTKLIEISGCQTKWLKEKPIAPEKLKIFYKQRIKHYLANKKNLDIVVNDMFLDCTNVFDDINDLPKYFNDPMYVCLIKDFISPDYLKKRKGELNDIIKKEKERDLSLFLIKNIKNGITKSELIEKLKKQKWFHENMFKEPVRIDLSLGMWLNNCAIKMVTELFPNIRELNLNYILSGDLGIEHLKNLKNLEVLSLRNSRWYTIDPKGFEKLTDLKNLRSLDISGNTPSITNENLHYLKNLTNLRKLILNGVLTDTEEVTNKTVKKLKNMLNPDLEVVIEDHYEEEMEKQNERSWRNIVLDNRIPYKGIENIINLDKIRTINRVYVNDPELTLGKIGKLIDQYPKLNIEIWNHSFPIEGKCPAKEITQSK